MERIAIIGDVHAEDALLERALLEARASAVSEVFCVGDIVDGLGSVDRCCELLRDHRVMTIRGNHDRWFLSDSARSLREATNRTDVSRETELFLAALPLTHRFTTPLGEALLCHGLEDNDMASVSPDEFGYALANNDELHRLLEDPELRLVFNGHTHRRMVRRFERVTIVNAGTLRRDHDPGFLVLGFDTGEVEWVALAGETARTSLGTLHDS